MGTLYYNNVGIIDRFGVGKHALDKEVDALRMRYNKNPLQGGRFVREETATGGVYTEASYGTNLELPRENEDSARLPFVTPIPGYKKSATIVNYRLALQVERSYTEDDLKSVIRKQMSGLINSPRLLIEYLIASWMNNLTSGSYLGADGVALVSATHPHERRETGTWSNSETSAALTLTTFSTGRKNLRKRTDEFGYPSPLAPRLLYGPPELEQKMRELKTAEKAPENALNQPNVWRNDDWDWFVYDYLSSTTGWGLIANLPQEYMGLVIAYGVRPNIAPLTGRDLSTDIVWGQRLRMRVVVSGQDGRWVQYNAGA